MSLIESLKLSRNETGISEIFPVTHLNSPHEFETRDGHIGSTIKVEGIGYETTPDDILNLMSDSEHQAIKSIDETMIVYITKHRRRESVALSGDFPSEFSRTFNNKYQKRFQGKKVFKNDLYITVLIKGDTSTATSRGLKKIEALWSKNIAHIKDSVRAQKSRKLKTVIQILFSQLQPFNPKVLGEEGSDNTLLSFLSLVPNGGKSKRFKVTPYFSSRTKDIRNKNDEMAYQEGNLGHYISSNRLLFGDYIQFQGASKKDVRFGAMLSIKKYPSSSSSVSLDMLSQAECEYIETHTFSPVPREVALKKVSFVRNRHVETDDKGVSELVALETLEDDVACERSILGYHHSTLMILNESMDALEEDIVEIIKSYGYTGFSVLRETIGEEGAFWAQIPGNFQYINRSALITSQNFVDFCSLHNATVGHNGNNHLKAPVTLIETVSKTPAFFNWHEEGSKDNPSKGMTVVLAPTDGGKTTLANALLSQNRRFNSRTFYLDRGEASKVYVLAEGGVYTYIHPDNEVLTLNPFSLPDSKENRTFLNTLLSLMVIQEGEERVPDSISLQIKEAVDYAYDVLSVEARTLSNISKIFSVNFDRKDALNIWLKGEAGEKGGAFSWVFDNHEDSLSLDNDFTGFDIAYLLDSCPEHISAPIYMYLVHRFISSLDGRLTTIVIDEFKQVLRSDYWVGVLNTLIPTMRKDNAHFVFMTQTVDSIIESKASAEIINNAATFVLLPNAQADEVQYKKHLKLNNTEFDFIKNTPKSAYAFLVKQGTQSMIGKMDLSDMSDEIRVLSGNKKSARLLDSIIEEVGSSPNAWLPVFNERSQS